MDDVTANVLTGDAVQVTGNSAGVSISNLNATGNTGTPGPGVAAALAANVGSAGAPVVNAGVLGTPSSGVATNLTGTAAGLTAGNVTNLGAIAVKVTGVNFNSADTDTPISIPLPSGVIRYALQAIRISDASGTLTTSTAGVFSLAAVERQLLRIPPSQSVQTQPDTLNNVQSFAAGAVAYDYTTIYFRVGTQQGSAATADVGRAQLAPKLGHHGGTEGSK